MAKLMRHASVSIKSYRVLGIDQRWRVRCDSCGRALTTDGRRDGPDHTSFESAYAAALRHQR